MDLSRLPRSQRVVACPTGFEELKDAYGFGNLTSKPVGDPDCSGHGIERQEAFASRVFENVNSFWRGQFAAEKKTYTEPKMHFAAISKAACAGIGARGTENMANYCSANSAVYIGYNYIDGLKKHKLEPSDFAPAMVIAHEVAHHVQRLRGLPETVRSQSYQGHPAQNRRSIATELQADCYAGAWAKNAVQTLAGAVSEQDVMSAHGFITTLGDGPHAISVMRADHGTGEERLRWFQRGYASGTKACDTFNAEKF